MFLTKSLSASIGGVLSRRVHGTGPLTVAVHGGEVKASAGDHIVEIPTAAGWTTLVLPKVLAELFKVHVTDEELDNLLALARARDGGLASNVPVQPDVVAEPVAPEPEKPKKIESTL